MDSFLGREPKNVIEIRSVLLRVLIRCAERKTLFILKLIKDSRKLRILSKLFSFGNEEFKIKKK